MWYKGTSDRLFVGSNPNVARDRHFIPASKSTNSELIKI